MRRISRLGIGFAFVFAALAASTHAADCPPAEAGNPGEAIAAGCSEATAPDAAPARAPDAAAPSEPAPPPVADAVGTPPSPGATRPSDETPASAAAGSAPDAAAAPSPSAAEAQGLRELELADQLLSEGEAAADDATRHEKYAAAKRHADRAIELMPQSADAHFVRFGAVGRLAQLDGLAAAAWQLSTLNSELDEVLRLNPNHANALAARGGMLMKLPRLLGGNTTRGVEYLERAVSLDDTAVGKRLELAEAYHIVGREEDAKRMADEALVVAQRLNEPDRVETCRRFIAELKTTCAGCAMAAIGR